ncbi:MAG: hypothetical protein R3B12_00545 [Candidatus Saccharimonadales bacterium]
MTLGKISSTGDKGDITKTSDMQPTKEQIEEALARFTSELCRHHRLFSY